MALVEKWIEAKREKEEWERRNGDLPKKEMTLADSDGKLVIERNSRLNS